MAAGKSNELLRTVSQDYDRVAEEYARRIGNELESKPLDRDVLQRFADRTNGRGDVCDLGCGPGHIAAFLRSAGAQIFGLDLSQQMLVQARLLSPEISFFEGNMFALDLPSGKLAGIVAYYSIVNLPADSLLAAFREMARVLQPGGLLLLAFHAGDEVVRPAELWGTPISMEFFFFQPEAIERLLHEAGFTIEETVEREPYAPEVEYQSHRAYIFARKAGRLMV